MTSMFGKMFKGTEEDKPKTLWQTLANYPSSYCFRQVLKTKCLQDIPKLLDNNQRNLTLFVPVNEAMQQFQGQGSHFGADMRPFLRDIVMCHIANSVVKSSAAPCFFENMCTDPNWVNKGGNGQLMQLMKDPECGMLSIMFGIPGWPMWTAQVWQADIPCSNGRLFFISKVLRFPYSLSSMCRLQGLGIGFKYALEGANLTTLANCTGKITVFVPQSCAIDMMMSKGLRPEADNEVLKAHHVVGTFTSLDLKEGQKLNTVNGQKITVKIDDQKNITVNGVPVICPNILCKNGVIHIVKDVLKFKQIPQSVIESKGGEEEEESPEEEEEDLSSSSDAIY